MTWPTRCSLTLRPFAKFRDLSAHDLELLMFRSAPAPLAALLSRLFDQTVDPAQGVLIQAGGAGGVPVTTACWKKTGRGGTRVDVMIFRTA